jgi:hypothetical protein
MNDNAPAPALEELAKPLRLSDVFCCSLRHRTLHLATCLDDYMNANALRVKSMVCHDCPQGAMVRECFAADAETEGLLDAEIWGNLIADFEQEEN